MDSEEQAATASRRRTLDTAAPSLNLARQTLEPRLPGGPPLLCAGAAVYLAVQAMDPCTAEPTDRRTFCVPGYGMPWCKMGGKTGCDHYTCFGWLLAPQRTHACHPPLCQPPLRQSRAAGPAGRQQALLVLPPGALLLHCLHFFCKTNWRGACFAL